MSTPAPAAPKAKDTAYRSHSRSSRFNIRAPPWPVGLLATVPISLVLAYLAFGTSPDFPPVPGLPWGGFFTAFLIFLVPLALGSTLAAPVSFAVGGKFYLRRAYYTALYSSIILGTFLVLARVLDALGLRIPVEAVLLLSYGLVLWFRQMAVMGVATPSYLRSLPISLVVPLLGDIMLWGYVGDSPTDILAGWACLGAGLLAVTLLLRGVNRPMAREFGEGGLAFLRPLMDHMNERDPLAQERMEGFFERLSTEGDLRVTAIGFRAGGKVPLAWVLPAVHPGPFGELGASDLPHKIAGTLKGTFPHVVVPHSPSTHDQDIPTSAEVARVIEAARNLLGGLSWGGSGAFSPLVSGRPGSLVRAQALGDGALVLITQAPQPTDDIDYAWAETIRDEGRKLGFREVAVVDAHNSYEAYRGAVPFGSPVGFQIVRDAREALEACRAAAGPREEIRVGFAQKLGYTPREDGIGPEGLSVTVVEVAGKTTAYALFDANNLVRGLRDPLVAVLRESVDDGEVMTTDNHVVHEVAGGLNPLGKLRPIAELSRDLRETLQEALGSLEPMEVTMGSTRVPRVKILGPGVTARLLTAVGDSFSSFWILFPTTFLLALAMEAAILLWLFH